MQGHAAGILTDRDLVVRGIASGIDPSTISVVEIMTRDPMFCSVDDSVRRAARSMQDSQVRRLPVLTHDRTVAGIVSLGDICNHSSSQVSGTLIQTLSQCPHEIFSNKK